jgi:hypothetical protein
VDEFFACFLEEFASETGREKAPDSSMALYRHRLPEQLLRYWNEHGWSGYSDGLFWTVNPLFYEPLLSHWLIDTEFYDKDNYHVIARSAFGDLYVWGENSGYCLTISSPLARHSYRISMFTGEKLDFGVKAFFLAMSTESNDFADMFELAVNKLGKLSSDEIYGFDPALALGGPIEFNNLQKVRTIEHLEFLSQLTPLTDWGFPEY